MKGIASRKTLKRCFFQPEKLLSACCLTKTRRQQRGAVWDWEDVQCPVGDIYTIMQSLVWPVKEEKEAVNGLVVSLASSLGSAGGVWPVTACTLQSVWSTSTTREISI